MDINDLIKLIQAGNVTISVTASAPVPTIDDDDDAVDAVAEDVETDFTVGDEVLICHIRRDGERVHTMGTVIETYGHDDIGYYTRVLGDNGKHYRAGLKYNEERLGTVICTME